MTTNKQLLVRSHVGPDEIIGPQHFELVESSIPEIGENEFLVRTLVLGTSPAQRGYVDSREVDIVAIGDVMRGRGIAVVEKSNHPDFQPGDWVNASTGWQEWSVQRMGRGPVQSMDVLSVQKVDNSMRPSSLNLGTLGSAAFAALYGIEDVCEVARGETVVVSAAAGGVGSMACQIAKALGARVIGIAGGSKKCEWLKSTVGCDATIDYKNDNVAEALQRHCPDGIDAFFDNVGGSILNDVLGQLATNGRVALCGHISSEYLPEKPPGPANYSDMILKRGRMQGFVIWDHTTRFPEFFAKMRNWFDEGIITSDVEEIMHGVESLPESLQSLFIGGNTGIRLVQVGADPDS
jgi:NADPH-dependent curcumin reductase CurA